MAKNNGRLTLEVPEKIGEGLRSLCSQLSMQITDAVMEGITLFVEKHKDEGRQRMLDSVAEVERLNQT